MMNNIWTQWTEHEYIMCSKTTEAILSCNAIDLKSQLEMWANAQRDGRPAEYSWRPLFNAAKFGWRPLLDAVQ